MIKVKRILTRQFRLTGLTKQRQASQAVSKGKWLAQLFAIMPVSLLLSSITSLTSISTEVIADTMTAQPIQSSLPTKPVQQLSHRLDIHTLCAEAPQQCLTNVEKLLLHEPSESRRWFQYKNYQLDALFELNRFEQLANEVEPWLARDDIPLKFQISVLIYSAKSQPDNRKELANQLINKAVTLLEDVSEVNHNPMLMVQIANSLNEQGEYQRGYDMLLPLVTKYQHRHMPRFQHELFENLGHFAIRLNKLDEHLEYRCSALKWASLMGNDNQIAISLYNVARAFQMLENYPKALEYFSKAEQLGKNTLELVEFRRAEIALAQGQLDKAQAHYAEVEHKQTQYYQSLFSAFESALSKAKDAARSNTSAE